MRRSRLFSSSSASACSSIYGVASTRKHWFAATVIEDAWRAAEAMKEVWDAEAMGLPPGAIDLAGAEPIFRRPSDVAQTVSFNPPEDLLLVTGGPSSSWISASSSAWRGDVDRRASSTMPGRSIRRCSGGNRKRCLGGPETSVPRARIWYNKGDLFVVFQGHNTFPFGVGVAVFGPERCALVEEGDQCPPLFDIDDNGLITCRRTVCSTARLSSGRPAVD